MIYKIVRARECYIDFNDMKFKGMKVYFVNARNKKATILKKIIVFGNKYLFETNEQFKSKLKLVFQILYLSRLWVEEN